MPNGFFGVGATRYLNRVSQAHSAAVTATSNTPSHAPPGPRTRQMPFTAEDAHTGARVSVLNRGDSSNIVVSREEYARICQQLDQADDRIGECIYRIASRIRAMNETIFRLPRATPQCQGISSEVSGSLGEMRSLTEEIILRTRRFANDITEIQ